MKKLILSALVVGSLLATSCKQAKEAGDAVKDGATTVVDSAKDGANAVVDGAKDGANAVVEGAKDGANAVADGAKDMAGKATDAVKSAVGLDGVTIPEFKDPKVGAYLTEYSAYAKEYIAAGADGYKNADLMKKGTDLATKSQEVIKSLGTDTESIKKFSSTLSAIASKMAPAAK